MDAAGVLVADAEPPADGQHGVWVGPAAGGRVCALFTRPAVAVPADRVPEYPAVRRRVVGPGRPVAVGATHLEDRGRPLPSRGDSRQRGAAPDPQIAAAHRPDLGAP